MSQLAFDFDLELDELWFPTYLGADRCRFCHRPIAGRHTRCASGGHPTKGYYVSCDDCVIEGRHRRANELG